MPIKLPHIPKEDVRVICLCSTIFISIMVIILLLNYCSKQHDDYSNALSPSELKTIEKLKQQIKIDSLHQERLYTPQISDSLFAFDPNHTDSVKLLKLGLSNWQVANMMKYRRKGGKWRSVDDFQRLYGLSKTDFKKLKPYIRIAEKDKRGRFVPFEYYYNEYTANKSEKPRYEKIEKLKEGVTLDLEHADTTILKQIPGIGSYYASKIVKYRERLGGFISTNQLYDIEGLPSNVSRWFTLSSQPSVKKIRINHATFKELVRHPYINYEQTKDIVNHVRQYGPLHSFKELRLYKEFSEKDFQRLEPYIQFD